MFLATGATTVVGPGGSRSRWATLPAFLPGSACWDQRGVLRSFCDETCVRRVNRRGVGWRVAASAGLARACASGAGSSLAIFSHLAAIELKGLKGHARPPWEPTDTSCLGAGGGPSYLSSCQLLSVAADVQSTDLCRAGATSRFGERCAQLPWCAHSSSDVWHPLAQPLSTISTQATCSCPGWQRTQTGCPLLPEASEQESSL